MPLNGGRIPHSLGCDPSIARVLSKVPSVLHSQQTRKMVNREMVWFVLVDARGNVLGPRARARLSDSACVADFQDAVKDACPNLFASVNAHRL